MKLTIRARTYIKLEKSQQILDLQKEALILKKKVDNLKGKNDPDIETALDDATSALDLFIHHLLDIYGD